MDCASKLKLREGQEEDAAQQYLIESGDYASDDSGKVEYIMGSPRVALQIEHPFSHYVFIERNKERVKQLEQLALEAAKSGRKVHVRQRDCNAYLTELLHDSRVRWREWRGVIFLDPFGMQVPWSTIAEIGKTKAIEVFINFPVGMAIQRLLKKNGQFSPNERARLDSYFGTGEWFDLLYRKKKDLFGDVGIDKLKDAGDRLVKWYRGRLQDAFGHVTTAREVQSTTGRPLYYLIFAGPNKKGVAIADHVLQQGARRVR